MQTCMQKYPTLYNKELGDDDDVAQALEQSEQAAAIKEDIKKSD